MNHTEGYNGWTNYETWAVNLWLSNDEGSYNTLIETVRGHTEDDAAVAVREWVEDMNPLADDASLFSDLLTTALQGVNWREIVRAVREDNDLDEEDEDDSEDEDDGL